MEILSVQEASEKLSDLIEGVQVNHEPLVITGKHKNAVLVAENDWTALNETLHLVSIPGMHESLRSGMQESIASTSKELKW